MADVRGCFRITAAGAASVRNCEGMLLQLPSYVYRHGIGRGVVSLSTWPKQSLSLHWCLLLCLGRRLWVLLSESDTSTAASSALAAALAMPRRDSPGVDGLATTYAALPLVAGSCTSSSSCNLPLCAIVLTRILIAQIPKLTKTECQCWTRTLLVT